MTKVLTVILIIVAVVLLLPMVGFRMAVAPSSVANPPTPAVNNPAADVGAKSRNIIGEITGTIATLIGAGKSIAGMLGHSSSPNDYQSQSGTINV